MRQDWPVASTSPQAKKIDYTFKDRIFLYQPFCISDTCVLPCQLRSKKHSPPIQIVPLSRRKLAPQKQVCSTTNRSLTSAQISNGCASSIVLVHMMPGEHFCLL